MGALLGVCFGMWGRFRKPWAYNPQHSRIHIRNRSKPLGFLGFGGRAEDGETEVQGMEARVPFALEERPWMLAGASNLNHKQTQVLESYLPKP